MIKQILSSKTKGQSLIFVAVLVTAIFGLLAFGVDAGLTFYMRRWSQNAADSGALAAAREICVNNDPATRFINAEALARDYVENKNLAYGVNSQSVTSITFGPDGGLNDGEVKVDVAINHPSFFANFFNTTSVTVPASATAGCFAPGAAFGVIPIAWKCHRTTTEDGKEICDMEFISNDDQCEHPTDYMYLFIEAPDKLYWCDELGPPPSVPEDVDVVIMYCGDRIEIVNTSHPVHSWSWVDLDGTTGQYCSTSELRDWVENGFGGTIDIHTWVPRCSGGHTDIYGSIADLDDSVIPVFDMICEGDDPQNDCNGPEPTYPDLWHDGIDTALDSLNADYYYHLMTFAKLRISCVDAQGNQCNQNPPHARQFILDNNEDNPDPDSDFKNIETIEGCMVEGFIPGLSGKPSDGVDSGAWTLYLTK
jgi:Flp pilus assembly protein TadG